MGTIAEKYWEAGKEKGIEKGKTEGKAEALLALLSQRFGPRVAARRSQVVSASERDLDQWIVRVLDAPDIDGVFDAGA